MTLEQRSLTSYLVNRGGSFQYYFQISYQVNDISWRYDHFKLICSIKPAINSLKAPPEPLKVEKLTIYTLSILNAYPYFWILWWKVLEERDVFGWLPCTLGEIELFLLVILCHDFGFFIFCIIFWLRQLCFLL